MGLMPSSGLPEYFMHVALLHANTPTHKKEEKVK